MTTAAGKPMEIFYSYAHEDEALRKELEKHLSLLKIQGLIVGWHDRLISAGMAWSDEIDVHLNTADIILLLISADFMASKYCYTVEMKRAMERHDAGEARVIPIILRPVNWQAEPSLHRLQALPTGGKAVVSWSLPPTYDEAFVDIEKGIRKVVEELRAKPLTASPKVAQVWNVPHRRNPFFTGREELLTHLHDRLTATGTTALTQAQAISGLGGIGKTQTAIEYAYRYRNEYQAIFWVRAATRESLLADVVEIARILNLPEQSEQDQEKIVTAVKRWLANSSGWLLILDNADDLRMVSDFLSLGDNGHLLLTTRAQVAGTLAESIDVEKMGKEEGTLLLLRRAKVLKQGMALEQVSAAARTQAEAIMAEMGGLPLALDQAGAYIEETGCSLADYLTVYRTRRRELLQHRSQLPTDHPEPVAMTWSLSFQKVEEANPAASALLQLCAFLDPDAIPEELLSGGADQLGEVLGPIASDAFQLNEALRVLRQYSLIRRNAETKTLTIHRLVQQVLKDNMDQRTQRQWAERAIRALNAAFPEVDQGNLSACDPYLPHVLACVPLIDSLGLSMPEAAYLLHKTGLYLYNRARYAEAEPFYQQALRIKEKVLGPEHSSTAITLHELARLYQDQGDYARAEPLYQRSLRIKENVLESEHPRIAATLRELARLYYYQRGYARAEPLYQRALTIYEKVLGFEHPDTATTLHQLAMLYQDQGDYARAEPLYQRALTIYEKVLGPEHPYTASTLHDLARLYQAQGDYARSQPLYQRALRIKEKLLGPEHPSTAITLHSLAVLYQEQGDYARAEALYQRSLQILEKTLGPEHPDTVITRRRYTDLLKIMKRKGNREGGQDIP